MNGDLCTGHGRCWTVAPEVYDADDNGFVIAATGVVDVPDGHEDEAIQGVRSCPEGALTIVER